MDIIDVFDRWDITGYLDPFNGYSDKLKVAKALDYLFDETDILSYNRLEQAICFRSFTDLMAFKINGVNDVTISFALYTEQIKKMMDDDFDYKMLVNLTKKCYKRFAFEVNKDMFNLDRTELKKVKDYVVRSYLKNKYGD